MIIATLNALVAKSFLPLVADNIRDFDPIFAFLNAKDKIRKVPTIADIKVPIKKSRYTTGFYVPGSADTHTESDVLTHATASLVYASSKMAINKPLLDSITNASEAGYKAAEMTQNATTDLQDSISDSIYNGGANALTAITTIIDDVAAVGGINPLTTLGGSAFWKAHVNREWIGSKTGTIEIAVGSTTLTGTSTLFTSELVVGDTIKVTDNGETYIIASIGSDTAAVMVTAGITLEASSAYTALQEKTYSVADLLTAVSSTNTYKIQELLSLAVQATTKGKDKVDLILAGSSMYNVISTAVNSKIVPQGSPVVNELGFMNFTFMGVPIVYSSELDTDTILGINSKYLFLDIWKDRDCVLEPFKKSETLKDTVLGEILWAGALLTNNRRMNFKIDTSP
jgi:hypothetical protein